VRVPTNLKPGQAEFNMTPMIDVVFLLIIFFLVSSHLAKQEAQMPLPLPAAESRQEMTDEDTSSVVVNVQLDGKIILGGHAIDADALKQRLEGEMQRRNEEFELRIRCDRDTPYANVRPIMLAAAEAGVWDVAFSVIRPEDVQR